MKSKTKSPSGQQAPIATTDDREIQSRELLTEWTRKTSDHPPSDTTLPDPEDCWDVLEYMKRWRPDEVHDLARFPPDRRDALDASIRILVGYEYVCRLDHTRFMLKQPWQNTALVHHQQNEIDKLKATPRLKITAREAAKRYQVTTRTIGRAVKDRRLHDYRAADHTLNAPHLLDEVEIAGRWGKRARTM